MLLYALILAAVGMRFLPHLPNFTPVGAILLFCGAWMAAKRLWVPMVAIIASDFLLTWLGASVSAAGNSFTMLPFTPTVDQYFTWASYAIYIALGLSLRNRVKLPRLVGTTLLGTTAFFLVSNFGVWFAGLLYPRTTAGLADCFLAGLPFAYRAAAGDVFFVAVFFGLHAWARQRQATRATVTA